MLVVTGKGFSRKCRALDNDTKELLLIDCPMYVCVVYLHTCNHAPRISDSLKGMLSSADCLSAKRERERELGCVWGDINGSPCLSLSRKGGGSWGGQ